jgi:NADH:ubiquinone reductase (H+-translocating)
VCTVPSTLPPVIQKLNCAKEKGKLLTNTGLELKDYEGQVWALGDCAAVKTVSGKEAPPTAQHAIREAATAATNIAAAIRGGARAEFGFEGLGTLGSLGHGAAVAQILGVKLSGLFAWVLWRCIYLMKMPGLNRKTRIATDWTLRLLFPPDLAETKLERGSGIQSQHFQAGDMVFQQGDLGDSVYVIQEGECDVLREENGERKLLATLKVGDYFGEMAVLTDQSRNATIQARTAMNVLIISKHDFDKLRQSVPAFDEVFREVAKRRASSSTEPRASASGIPVNPSGSSET